jgi:hypothetical protein
LIAGFEPEYEWAVAALNMAHPEGIHQEKRGPEKIIRVEVP